ncbi:glycosyltransferase [Phenylobacterium hankyongense]|uniref:glycosyltransferase n=1 Tax=Phenylobacterium hankyongense TaxID=1813876 RepID=UPI001FB41D18|nr:glycosyltransferase [Phenylobacterium hankyongense]
MKLAYFVHDLADPAVTRRVRMLQAGGAQPVVLGFRRTDTAPETIAGAPAVDLGRTYDARLGHRAKATARAALTSGRWRELLAGAEVVMARTLEMLAVAEAARRTCRLDAPLVYECLDIHRLMLGEGAKSRAMRAVERALMRRASLLIVSSPAFLEAYFEPRQGVGATLPIPTLLMENKVLELEPRQTARPAPRPPGPPWRIGWMGAIRCRKSLDILTALAARRPDLVEVVIHGRPAYTEFDDFDAQVAAAPNVSFGGAYTAADLPRLYGDVHFSWAIDYMEEGQNSSWLLPNRIYESGRYGATPIALAGVQTGRYLAEHGFGVRLGDPGELEGFLEGLTAETYAGLRQRLDAVPSSAFVADAGDCGRLVEALVDRPVGLTRQQPLAAETKLVA